MNNPIESTPEDLQAMFPDVAHALENEFFRQYLSGKLKAKFSCISGRRTTFIIRLTHDCVMELRPTDILNQNVPTWFMSMIRIKKETGERDVKKILRANVVVRRALPEDSTILLSQTLMVPNFKHLVETTLEFANRESGLDLEVVKNRSSKTS
ncbi:MAG: hypothetical protein RIS43_983 [Actinomycetota bacterium]